MALEFVTSVLEPIVKHIFKPIGREIGYLIFYRRNIHNLKNEVDKLDEIKQDVERSIQAAPPRNLEVGEAVFVNWLEVTNEILKETKSILPSAADTRKGCLSQGLKSRYVLSKKAKVMSKIVIRQQTDMNKCERFPHLTHLAKPWTTSETNSGKSRQVILTGIMQALCDDQIEMIGIHGQGGVGKTRMAKEVRALVKKSNMFDEVVLAMASKYFNLEIFQGSVAEELGLILHENDVRMRARRLFERLRFKKILLILDDVWEKPDLELVGFPMGDENNGCKVMLTSRNLDVLTYMPSRKGKIFTISSLSDEEALDLFRRVVGESLDDPALDKISKKIVKECGGLPLAILTIAISLKGRPREIWEFAHVELRKGSLENINGLGHMHNSLRLSYDMLDSKEAKELYLHCCLFPEGYSIPLESLARRGMSLGMFYEGCSLQDARSIVRRLVDMLKGHCLVMTGKDASSIIMHDVVRDVGIHISSTEHRFGINHDWKLNQWPTDIHHEEVTCISVRFATTVKHPETLNWPRLEFLDLEVGDTSASLNDDIFQGMRTLKTIEISYMQFSLLPSSLRLLKNLRMLRLFGCTMENISLIGELVDLEILSLRDSRFLVFPAELGKLNKLKLLDLSLCKTMEIIEPGTLPSFVELEELDMTGCDKFEWEVETEVKWRRNSSLVELKAMENLSMLSLRISDKAIPKETSLSGELTEYYVWIGPFEDHHTEYSKMLWCDCNAEDIVDWIRNIVVSAEHLVLRKGIAKHVIDLLARQSTFQHVKSLEVAFCDEVMYVANTSYLIYPGKAPSQYNWFAKLECINISACKEIVYFLSMPFVSEALPLLTHLKMSNCEKLEQVFFLEEENVGDGHGSQIDRVEFPSLKRIELDYLEALKSFCHGIHNIELPSLETLCIKDLPNSIGFFPNDDALSTESNQSASAQFLFRTKVPFGGLKELYLKSLESDLWFRQLSSTQYFCKLQILHIENCHEMRSLFSSSSIGVLKNLKELKITDCSQIEAVIAEDEGEGSTEPLYLELKSLILEYLPNLGSFSQIRKHNALQLSSLESVQIANCSEMKIFAQGSISTPSLRELQINWIDLPVNDINSSLIQLFEEQHAKEKEIEEVAE